MCIAASCEPISANPRLETVIVNGSRCLYVIAHFGYCRKSMLKYSIFLNREITQIKDVKHVITQGLCLFFGNLKCLQFVEGQFSDLQINVVSVHTRKWGSYKNIACYSNGILN